MNTSRKHNTQLAVLVAAALLGGGRAAATTVAYNFDETGWINTAGTTENFVGSFTGTPEGNGVLALTDLTEFTAILNETNAQGDTKTIATFGLAMGTSGLTDLLFDPTAGTLTLAATGNPGAQICLGDTVAEGVCGPVAPRPVSRDGVPAPPLEGLFISSVNGTLSAFSTNLPEITMVEPLMPVQAPGPATTTPEPASWLLCSGALVLALAGLRRTRSVPLGRHSANSAR